MAQAEPPHRPGCEESLRNIDAGYSDEGREFAKTYHLQLEFPVECLGCCLDYLTDVREYERLDVAAQDSELVCFLPSGVYTVPAVSCFVKRSQRGPHGQVATGQDPTLGKSEKTAVTGGETYRFYSPAGGLAVGTVITARMESLEIRKASSELLASIYLNYTDATLLELYREQHETLGSLKGTCRVKKREEAMPNINKLNITND